MNGAEVSGPGPEHKAELDLRPRIYVASLSDYNNGRLHGNWFEANQDVADLQEAVGELLRSSPFDDAEEWAIHDYEGFGGLALGEHEPLERIARLGRNIFELGFPYALWVASGVTDDESARSFEDHYRGSWPSAEDYAEDVLNDLGVEQAINACIPGHLKSYVRVDSAGLARDLKLSGDIWTAEDPSGGVHVYGTDS